MTLMKKARSGLITKQMEIVAAKENLKKEFIRHGLAEGTIAIPANIKHKNLDPIGIGNGLKTKINANIGTSNLKSDINGELEKLSLCVKYKADTVMDLSTSGDLDKIRIQLIKNSSLPFGTVPIYQTVKDNKTIEALASEDFIETIEKQAKQGVDFITIHAGLLRKTLPLLKTRKMGIVSRGGAIISRWIKSNNKENPFYSQFEQILDIASEYDVTLSLGDGLRPGCLADATDKAQLAELKILGDLTLRAWQKNVQIIIEGPGHIPLDQIKFNVEIQKKYCHNAPFYVLGPLVTDIAPGYDHITAAIGGALAGMHGANFLCYVTPSEHLSLPSLEDVKQGIIVTKIAAHAVDIANGIKDARNWDDEMSNARFNFDWEKQFKLALDPETARKKRSDIEKDEYCSMCGKDYCSMRNYKG
ncbi:phosphomethylpyrimidine synthase ThiC [Candidatus Woesearchaeota archaeon]|nr:phosphomethylpyrimidine synthase ThiC [Candidatus Woesearchaeota archaeon]